MTTNAQLIDLIKHGPTDWIETVRRGDTVTRVQVHITPGGNRRVTVLSTYNIYDQANDTKY